jgi:hypothetical protein
VPHAADESADHVVFGRLAGRHLINLAASLPSEREQIVFSECLDLYHKPLMLVADAWRAAG